MLLLPAFSVLAQTAAVGGELQVNSYTTGNQFAPGVTSGPDGAFVVVWESDDSTAWSPALP